MSPNSCEQSRHWPARRPMNTDAVLERRSHITCRTYGLQAVAGCWGSLHMGRALIDPQPYEQASAVLRTGTKLALCPSQSPFESPCSAHSFNPFLPFPLPSSSIDIPFREPSKRLPFSTPFVMQFQALLAVLAAAAAVAAQSFQINTPTGSIIEVSISSCPYAFPTDTAARMCSAE